MFRNPGSGLLAAALTIAGCNAKDPESVAQEQRQEQRDLAQDQRQERQELAQDQAAQRAEARDDAREELDHRVETAQEQRQDSNEASAALARTAALACQVVSEVDACPVAGEYVRSSSNVDDGVLLQMRSEAGTKAELEQRIECYRARATLRGTPSDAANACVFDLPGEEIAYRVEESDGRVSLQVTTSNDARVGEIRNRVRQLAARTTASRQNRAPD